MKYVLYAMIGLLALSACQPKPADKGKPLEEIDSTMQAQVQTLLKDKMEETHAYAGQVLVMDAATGKMRVCAGWLRTKDGTYQEAPKCMDRYPLYYMRSTAFLAAMQTGKVKLTDTVNVGNGIYVRGTDTIRDGNSHRGGYGPITYERALSVESNVAHVKMLEKAFGTDTAAFRKGLRDLGGDRLMTTLQMLGFCRQVASGGEIAAKEHLASMRQAMCLSMEVGFGKPAQPEKVQAAGLTDIFRFRDETTGELSNYLQFCGYVPAEHPQYCILVSLCKKRNDGVPPSSGLMAGDLFKQVVDSVLFVE